MSAPRLVLLTGPAAGEVAAVFRQMAHGLALRYVTGNGPASTWDEVRDYWEAPRCIAGVPDAVAIEHGIREFPGGTEWLVGLVLPETAWYSTIAFQGGEKEAKSLPEFAHHIRENGAIARKEKGLPARLAILAPEPPPLLVERVRAWGGEVWECGISAAPATAGKCLVTFGTKCFYADTWPEVVRAALGEVAP